MAGSDSDDKNSRDDRESNPFVVFRRFADEQLSSAFNRFSEPFQGDWNKREEALRQAHQDAWKRFESSYERATNPERRQTERRSEDDPVHAAPPPRYRSLEVQTNEQREQQNREGRSGRPWWMMSKESGADTPASSGQTIADAAEEQASESRHCGRRPRTRTVTITPFGVEPAEGAEDDRQRQGTGQCGPFSWSWSWGPWNIETKNQTEESRDAETETRTHSFGPWTFGPFHVGSMTTSTTFPKHIEQDLQSMFSEIEQIGKHFAQAEERLVAPHMARSSPNDPSYSPLALSQDGQTNQRVNWCMAFEDLMAANRGEEMPSSKQDRQAVALGSSQHQNGQWLTHMMRRGMIDEHSAWHREMFSLHRASPPSQQTQQQQPIADDQGPETELDFYERQELLSQSKRERKPEPLRVDIISRISTVERVMLPDGSITTKRTMKKRFADGTEETEDSTEQSPARPQVQRLTAGEQLQSTTENSEPKKPQSKGWFW